MTDTTLRARSTSEIVDAAFALYRQNFTQYTVVTAVCYSPVLILQLLSSGTTVPNIAIDPGKMFMAAIPAYLVSMVTFALVSGAIAHMGSAAYLGEETDVGVTIRAVLPRVPAIIGSSLVYFVLIFLSAMLFLLPSLYVVARFFAVTQAIVIENKGVGAAFRRSSVLSHGRKWSVLLTLLLTWGIYLVLSIGITAGVRAILGAIPSLIVASVFAVFAYPIVNLVVLVMYYDSRIRIEGFDVEHMSRSLGVPTAFAPMGGQTG